MSFFQMEEKLFYLFLNNIDISSFAFCNFILFLKLYLFILAVLSMKPKAL
jgi:hypothetical protein